MSIVPWWPSPPSIVIALRDYKTLQIYRGIRHTLAKRGIKERP